MRTQLLKFAILTVGMALSLGSDASGRDRWTPEQAKDWQTRQPWLVGCNFSPSTAINQLEMWQADTFDPDTIDRELGWASGIGFNSVRVFLHNLLWQQDREGFLRRFDRFLKIADKHGIGVMVVPLTLSWVTSRSIRSERTTGDSWRARLRPSTRGKRGRNNTRPNPNSGFTTSFARKAHRTMPRRLDTSKV